MSKTPEGIVKDACKALLKARGIYAFWPVQTGYGRRTLDCLACYRGHFLGIEVKRGDRPAVPEPRQQTIIEEIVASGGTCLVVNDVEQLEKWLLGIDRMLELAEAQIGQIGSA